MNDVFDMHECIDKSLAAIAANDQEALDRPLDPDPKKGPEAVAALLTYLPPEQRMGALTGFVAAMLCD